jgi:hypothetical protein
VTVGVAVRPSAQPITIRATGPANNSPWFRGYSDPEGEFSGGEMTCSIEKFQDGYHLLIEHDGEIQVHESHGRIETARGKAEIIKAELLSKGFME